MNINKGAPEALHFGFKIQHRDEIPEFIEDYIRKYYGRRSVDEVLIDSVTANPRHSIVSGQKIVSGFWVDVVAHKPLDIQLQKEEVKTTVREGLVIN